MRKIILPTDGSTNAQHAMRYAFGLFEGQEVEFVLFRSIDTMAYATDVPFAFNELSVNEVKSQLERDAAALREEFKGTGFRFRCHASLGALPPCLDELVEDEKADLIVMGTTGATGLAGAIIGSNASDVIAGASCPVIAVPAGSKVTRPKRILFATDNRGLSDPSIISPLLGLARQCAAHIQLVHVLEEGETITVEEAVAGLRLNHLIDGIDHSFLFLSGSDKALAIEQHMGTNDIDLLATVPRRANFFDAIFHRSVTRQLALHTKVPLLAMHDLGN